MSGAFDTPKAVKPPPVAAVEAPPTPTEVEQAGEQTRKRKSSRRATFLTGDLVPETAKKSTLG